MMAAFVGDVRGMNAYISLFYMDKELSAPSYRRMPAELKPVQGYALPQLVDRVDFGPADEDWGLVDGWRVHAHKVGGDELMAHDFRMPRIHAVPRGSCISIVPDAV